jgi:hypothetical protein
MRVIILLAFISVSTAAIAQFSSFETLKNKFKGENEVFAISTSGFLARTVLWMAGEHDFRNSIRDISHVRLITIPKQAFRRHDVTVNGFKKLLVHDGYEELGFVKDHGDDVTLYMLSDESSKKRKRNGNYFLLVEGSGEVVALEIHGQVDPEMLLHETKVAFNNDKSYYD